MKYFAFLSAFLMSLSSVKAFAQEGYAGSWQLGFQPAASVMKQEMSDFHDLLLWIITAIVIVCECPNGFGKL